MPKLSTLDAAPPLVEIAGLLYPATLNTTEAAAWLGYTAETLTHKRGTGILPVEPLELGRKLRWPTIAVAAAVGLQATVVAADALPDTTTVDAELVGSDPQPDADGSA
jgi:hypothetical protein